MGKGSLLQLSNATVVLENGHGLSRAIRIICFGAEILIQHPNNTLRLYLLGRHFSFQPNYPMSRPAHPTLYSAVVAFWSANCTSTALPLYACFPLITDFVSVDRIISSSPQSRHQSFLTTLSPILLIVSAFESGTLSDSLVNKRSRVCRTPATLCN
jgi:hypothetical protein